MNNFELDDRVNFVRKVYSILACQLSLTAAFIVLVKTNDKFTNWMMTDGGPITIVACILSIVTMFMIVCCFGRQAPLNMILLMVFTLCETWMIGGLTSQYESSIVIQAGAATALVTISLTVYAMNTKVPIEFFGALSFVICLAMIPLFIVSLFMQTQIMYTVYCCFGALLYGIYLIIDTILITGGKQTSNVKISMDDYIIGALMLYIDIVMLFVYILRILGNK